MSSAEAFTNKTELSNRLSLNRRHRFRVIREFEELATKIERILALLEIESKEVETTTNKR